jgi:hypothetical protein
MKRRCSDPYGSRRRRLSARAISSGIAAALSCATFARAQPSPHPVRDALELAAGSVHEGEEEEALMAQ